MSMSRYHRPSLFGMAQTMWLPTTDIVHTIYSHYRSHRWLIPFTVPHLYALWWVKSHEGDPATYPLPHPLSNLLASDPLTYNGYRTMKPLTSHLETAMIVLWESQYRTLLDLMLVFYLAGGSKRNNMQHPKPTCRSAMELLEIMPGLSCGDLVPAALLVQLSTTKFNGISQPSFDHGEGPGNIDEGALDEELESWVKTQHLESDQMSY
jgi:hypothetical protein